MRNARGYRLTGKSRAIPSGKEKRFGFFQNTKSVSNTRVFPGVQRGADRGCCYYSYFLTDV